MSRHLLKPIYPQQTPQRVETKLTTTLSKPQLKSDNTAKAKAVLQKPSLDG